MVWMILLSMLINQFSYTTINCQISFTFLEAFPNVPFVFQNSFQNTTLHLIFISPLHTSGNFSDFPYFDDLDIKLVELIKCFENVPQIRIIMYHFHVFFLEIIYLGVRRPWKNGICIISYWHIPPI